MERLTNKKLKIACDYFVNFASKEEAVKYRILAEAAPKYEEIYKKLADYEDKQEQGLLIELPVPIGSTVYEIFYLYKHGTLIEEREMTLKYYADNQHRFGNRVFFTRSEAEEALARMKGE